MKVNTRRENWLKAARTVLDNSLRLIDSSEAICALTENYGHAYALLVLAEEEQAKAMFCLSFAFGEVDPSDSLLRDLRNHDFKQEHIAYMEWIYRVLDDLGQELEELPSTVSLKKLAKSGKILGLDDPQLLDAFSDALAGFWPKALGRLMAVTPKDMRKSVLIAQERVNTYWWRKNEGLYVDLEKDGRCTFYLPEAMTVERYREKLSSRANGLRLFICSLETNKGWQAVSQRPQGPSE